MYQNHNLRSNLQEWKNRLFKANYEHANDSFNFFFEKILAEKKLKSIIEILNKKYAYSSEQISQWIENFRTTRKNNVLYESEEHRIYLYYNLLKYLRTNSSITKFSKSFAARLSDNSNDLLRNFLENFVDPFVNYLHDHLDDDNTVLYLLEKYKKRTEWFTKKILLENYKNASKSFEQIFEDDLRMFLFDQGIENPFSTPKSASGRADIVGNIDTEEPLVLEIKIIDSAKGYKINRIKEGFKQIIDYANDYNKNIGYLVIFNIDQTEIEYKFNDQKKYFPPCFEFNNKFYYFITINLNYEVSASKSKLKIISVTDQDLLI